MTETVEDILAKTDERHFDLDVQQLIGKCKKSYQQTVS